jgi:hypothetical protein
MGRFWDYLKSANPPPGELPLIHNTDLFFFREIRASDQLTPSQCDVYKGENLLYFFYGRPSYRSHANLNTVTARALLPVCLVLSRTILPHAARIVAFDTGAFARKFMHPPMHEKMAKEDFELAVAPDAPMKLIQVFYGDEDRYFRTKPNSSIANYDEFEDLEIDSYFRLLNHRSNSPFDDRVSAIEIQLNVRVLFPGVVRAAILPKPYLDKSGVIDQIERWGGIAIPYNVKEEFIPREIHGAIFDRLTDFLSST